LQEIMTDKRALIVDDDYANRAIWDLVLTDRGYKVLAAPDSATATALVSDDVTLYLVDYHLPDGHGSDFVSFVRRISTQCVVITTSMDDDADVIRESMRAGSNIFMVKPSSPSIIRDLLAEIDTGDVNPGIRQLINRNGRRTYAGA
jgi:DNA-binding response OmpR family regulator